MTKTTKSRLWFIDAARSLAIILMLQGHFISLTVSDYGIMADALNSKAGTSGNIFFDFWYQLRGFTAPLFFTITGLVFVYLLTGKTKEPFWKQKRVKRGLTRGLTIIAWGYLLQLNFKNVNYYLAGKLNDRFFAFHVLQSIGIGILVLIILYALHSYVKRINFTLILFFSAIGIFTLYQILDSPGAGYFPKNAPQIIQNAMHGPKSVFPLTPWLGYILLGGSLGSIIRSQAHRLQQKWFPLILVLVAVAINHLSRHAFLLVDRMFDTEYAFGNNGWFFYRFTEIIVLIGVLMYMERIINKKETLFIKMGQNTLVIYIVHVILLYGAIIGIGLRTWFEKSLTFTESIIGAIVFILFFGLLTYIQPKMINMFKRINPQNIKNK